MGFTPDQNDAINFDKGNCLVAAGAGSGKTAVLSERVLTLIKDNKCKLDELLILTFTNKAAFEMKERIRKKLSECSLTKSSLDYVDQSDITTFDAFALNIATKYYSLIGLETPPTLIDGSLLEVYKNKELDKIIEEKSQQSLIINDEFYKFNQTYFDKNFVKLKQAVLSLLDEAYLQEDKDKYLNELIAKSTTKESANNRYLDLFKAAKEILLEASLILNEYENSYALDADNEYLNLFLNCSSLEEMKQTFISNKAFTKASKDWEMSELDTKIRKKLKDKFGEAKAFFDITPDSIYEDQISIKPYMEVIVSLTKELDKRLDAYKKENSAYSFSDIFSLARKIISLKEVNEKLRNHYKYIMVDEYQDTSDLQESLLNALSSNNVFAVGDIKQSIYRFRNANPLLFSEKMEKYSRNENGTLIILSSNFRSRKEVLDGINKIFEPIMTKDRGGVSYKNNQALNFGNTSYSPSENPSIYGIKCLAYNNNKDEVKDVVEEQAKQIAIDILSKVNRLEVLDKESKLMRKSTFSDFAILIDKKTQFDKFQKVFSSYHIPLKVTFDRTISSFDIVVILKNLLSLVYELSKDPTDYIKIKHLYVSLSRSCLYQEKDEDIYSNVLSSAYLETPLIKKAKSISSKVGQYSLGEMVKELIVTFPILESLLTSEESKANLEQIINFLSKAKQSESLGYDEKEYIDYFDSSSKYGTKISIDEPDVAGDLVSLMSIHASKGLEFKIVYLPCLTSSIKAKGSSKDFFQKSVGLSLPIYSSFTVYKQNVLLKLPSYYEKKEEISEKMRLFYVACTRAEELLIPLIPSSIDEKMLGKPSLLSFLLESNFKLDFINNSNASLYSPKNVTQEETIDLRSFKCTVPENAIHRPSKQSYSLDYNKIIYGERMHRYMELVSFANKDLSFISNASERKKIEHILSLPIFKDVSKGKKYCEYSYYDFSSNTNGTIDMFVVYEDHIDLFDYKSNNIDDSSYDEQIKAYASYLTKAFNKKVYGYLLSIGQGRIRQVNI